MHYTAYTAFILTCHHLGVATALIVAIFLSSTIFLLFIRNRKHQRMALLLTFISSMILGIALARELFEQEPFSLEMVRAG